MSFLVRYPVAGLTEGLDVGGFPTRGEAEAYLKVHPTMTEVAVELALRRREGEQDGYVMERRDPTTPTPHDQMADEEVVIYHIMKRDRIPVRDRLTPRREARNLIDALDLSRATRDHG